MVEGLYHQYIQDFILKSGEELEWNSPTSEDLIEVKIIKRTERTFRVLGLLTLSIRNLKVGEIDINPLVESLALTPRKKVILDHHDTQTFRWLEQGWIIKEVRFEKDEKTVRTSHYRMGFNLYQYEHLQIQNKELQTRDEFLAIKDGILSAQVQKFPDLTPAHRKNGVQHIINIINELEPNELKASIHFPKKWSLVKRLKYLHFINAFCRLSLQKEEFDWKEIGASYFQKIGGSKEFDMHKQDFLDQLEEWASVPVESLGLISLGQIIPVFFAGHLKGEFATFNGGSVHALTNLSIVDEAFQTEAKTLWLVENRAILTHMTATKDFIKDTHSLIVCVDGHLRSAHKNAISQILKNSRVEQAIIWCDYDSDGFQISNEIYKVVNQFNELTLKWILPDKQITSNRSEYEQYLTNFLLTSQMEQEQMMGGADNWITWIQG